MNHKAQINLRFKLTNTFSCTTCSAATMTDDNVGNDLDAVGEDNATKTTSISEDADDKEEEDDCHDYHISWIRIHG